MSVTDAGRRGGDNGWIRSWITVVMTSCRLSPRSCSVHEDAIDRDRHSLQCHWESVADAVNQLAQWGFSLFTPLEDLTGLVTL